MVAPNSKNVWELSELCLTWIGQSLRGSRQNQYGVIFQKLRTER